MNMNKEEKIRSNKIILGRTVIIFFAAVDWIMFVGFSILAAHFMIDVLANYQAKTTSFSQSLEPILKMPTIVMCVEGHQISNFKEDIKLGYHAKAKKYIAIKNIKEHKKYILKDANETFQVLQVRENCIRLESNLTWPYKHGSRIIVLESKNPTTQIHFYFTSKANSIGSLFRQWWDGQVLDIIIGVGRKAKVSIQASEKRYLNFENQCSDISHLDKWASTNPEKNFMNDSNCVTKCSPTPLLLHLLPFCGWGERAKIRCATNRLKYHLRKYTANVGYERPCNILEYQGYKTFEAKKFNNKSLTLEYSFAPPFMTSVQQEYLIFDITGMIGSVGGTLGMCIGFSFSGITTIILNFIKSRIMKLL